ncbi:MAG: hypothetical protein HOA52_01200 [Flavobacteriales bacterium]|jgi:hypothetical protein|nr:hypothetical protein [Flavobacteriales bacterium]
MKKILLVLITITTLTNVSYASFPVTETEQTEVVEYDSINNLPVSFIGVLVGIFSWLIFPLNLLLPIFIKDRSFRKSVSFGLLIGIPVLIVIIFILIFASGGGIVIL